MRRISYREFYFPLYRYWILYKSISFNCYALLLCVLLVAGFDTRTEHEVLAVNKISMWLFLLSLIPSTILFESQSLKKLLFILDHLSMPIWLYSYLIL